MSELIHPEALQGAPRPPLTLMQAGGASFPIVNLLPPAVMEEFKVRKARMVLLAGAGAAALVVGAGWVLANQSAQAAEQTLAQAQAQNASLLLEAARYSTVPATEQAIDQAEGRLVAAMGDEVRWSIILTELSTSMPANVSLTSFNATVAPAGESATTAPGTTPGIGTVTFAGEGLAFDDVADWLDVLAEEPIYAQSLLSRVAQREGDGANGVDFDASATLTDAAASGRYTEEAP